MDWWGKVTGYQCTAIFIRASLYDKHGPWYICKHIYELSHTGVYTCRYIAHYGIYTLLIDYQLVYIYIHVICTIFQASCQQVPSMQLNS